MFTVFRSYDELKLFGVQWSRRGVVQHHWNVTRSSLVRLRCLQRCNKDAFRLIDCYGAVRKVVECYMYWSGQKNLGLSNTNKVLLSNYWYGLK